MNASDIIKEPVAAFASRLEAMTDDEMFSAMHALERQSEAAAAVDRDEILSRIALTEAEIEKRFPGQVLAPYRDWKKSQPLL